MKDCIYYCAVCVHKSLQVLMSSAHVYTVHDVQVVGMGNEWTGGDIANYPGGGQKINLLKPVVKKWKGDKNTLLMFTDRSVLLVSPPAPLHGVCGLVICEASLLIHQL